MVQNIALPLPCANGNGEGLLLRNLPQEMMVDILSRLPMNTVMRCKSVCKSWHDLIEGSEFATAHLSKSSSVLSCLAVIPEFLENHKIKIKTRALVDDACCITSKKRAVTLDFDIPYDMCPGRLVLHSSVNGLLLLMALRNREGSPCIHLVMCNPITREHMELPPPPPRNYGLYVFGFGASRVSGKYKIVMIFWEFDVQLSTPVEGLVYTAGGLWRSINHNMPDADHCPRRLLCEEAGELLNGNLHWLASNYESEGTVCCFDLETELFTFFCAPTPSPARYSEWLSVVEGRLCLCACEVSDNDNRIALWFMNKYGDDKSWAKEFIIITKSPPPPSYMCSYNYHILPIKVFKDGDAGSILFAMKDCPNLFFYSQSMETYDPFQVCRHYSYTIKLVVYTPTFLSLQTITMG